MPFTDPVGRLLIGNPSWGELMMRAAEIKGDLPEYVEQYVQGEVQLDNLLNPEYSYLRRMSRYHGGRTIAAAAGAFTGVAFAPQSGITVRSLCVVERLVISNPNAGAMVAQVAVGVPSVAIVQAGGVGPNPSDDRLMPAAAGAAVSAFYPVTNSNAVAMLSGFDPIRFDIPGNSSVQVDIPFVLTNKSPVNASTFAALLVEPSAVNLGIRVSFSWRERQLLSTEQ
jgi:hypothetical protein